MDYAEAANFLFDLRRFRMKPGLDPTRRLLGYLDDPHRGPEYIQIAGSNGKGSTARMLESILRESGLDVGLYTSPHVNHVRERIRVNGRPITKAVMTEFIETIYGYAIDRATTGESPTFFEVLTAMALWQFGREDIDVGVIEVGIGGKLDATSVVSPAASAVTSVTLEHTDVLGDSIEAIARDKAHVAPADAPLVTGAAGDALTAIKTVADDVVVVGEDGDVRISYNGLTSEGEAAVDLNGPGWHVDARLALLGPHQARNAGIAAVLAKQVAEPTTEEISRGLRTAVWPGRFEVMARDPLVVLDGAHNPGACRAVATTLGEFSYDDLIVVYGAMHDKDHAAMVRELPTPDRVFTCQPNLDRAEDHDVLAAIFERAGVGDVTALTACESATARALEAATADDCVLVTGSLYTVREARTRWTRLEIPKAVRDLDDAQSVLEGAHVSAPGVWRMRAKGVQRTLKTRLHPRQAGFLKEELLSLGGDCALSSIREDEEYIDVVMMGSLAQFKRLADKLEDQPYGLAGVGGAVREALGIGVDESSGDYPWLDGTAVMGVINVTPDSFHDGGAYVTTDVAVNRASKLVEAGADIVDVGGESTRPGAAPISVDEEIRRVIPVVERIADLDALVSIDTRKAAVARAALDAGADIVNDVSGLEDPSMRFVAADHDVPIVVMHSINTPVVPERRVVYDDVVEDVIAELRERVLLAEKAGVDRSQIIVDPGLGFGKGHRENFALLGRIGELHALGCPVLVGHSHKSMFDYIDRGPGERGPATIAATAIAVDRGADIVRVHDVAENVAAVRAVVAATQSG